MSTLSSSHDFYSALKIFTAQLQINWYICFLHRSETLNFLEWILIVNKGLRILGTKKLQCDQFLVYLLRSKRSKCWWANFNSFKEGDNPFPFLEHLAFYWHEIRQKTKNTHANFLKIAYFICSIELGSTRFMGTSWVC